MHGFRQRDADHMIFVGNGRIEGDGKPFRVDLPARRGRKLLNEIPSMREIAGEGQLSFRVCHTHSQEIVGHQSAVIIVDVSIIVQPEGEAFTGNGGDDLPGSVFLLDDL